MINLVEEVLSEHRPERGDTWCAGCLAASGRLVAYPCGLAALADAAVDCRDPARGLSVECTSAAGQATEGPP